MTLAVTATLLLGGAAALAGIATATDAALMAGDGDEPPSSGAAASAARAREHRSLAAIRITALLLAGIALGMLLRNLRLGTAGTLLLGIPALVLIGAVVEGVGRAFGDKHAALVRARTGGLLSVASALMGPFVGAGERVDAGLDDAAPDDAEDDAEESLAATGFQELVLRIPTARIDKRRQLRSTAVVNGIFALSEMHAEAVMVPRVDVVAIDRDTPWADVVARVRSAGFARYPVYVDTIDEIVGILYAKDLLPAIVADEPPPDGWHALIRPASFIPATRTLEAQLRDFQLGRTHIAVVVDEYGGTAGIVTIEDILEEIVGDIRDEYDEEDPAVEHEEGERYWVASRVTLEELGEILDHHFDVPDVQTVGGLIYAHLGRVPKPGESFELEGFRVIVEQVRRRRIRRVYFERVASPHEEHAAR